MTFEANIVAGVLAVGLQLVALYGAKNLRGTTLMVPALWVATAASCLLLLAVTNVQPVDELTRSVVRFTMAAVTLCPLMAVLGAKRPQDRGWQWVVAALWLIVVWPALQALAHPAGPALEISAPWKLFVASLIAMGPLNYLLTNYWLASMFVAGGQLVLFSRFLGIHEPDTWFPAAAVCLIVAAALVWRTHRIAPATGDLLREQTARWLWFRDAFGAFWALRIMQRVNETAALRNWPVRLAWSGFERVSDQPLIEEHATEARQSLDTLLRRFL